MTKNPRIAVIGIGRWGKKLIEAFSRQHVEIVCCFHQGKVENKDWLSASYPQIYVASSYAEILDDQSVDALIIVTPIKTHFDLALKALKNGKHVFVEKPGTESAEEMRDLCIEAEKRGLIIGVGYVFAHHPACQYLAHIVRNEEAKSISFEWNKWGTFEEDLLLNLVSHELSILKMFGIDIDHMKIEVSCQPETTIADSVKVKLESTKGIPITMSVNRKSHAKNKTVTLITDQATYRWSNEELSKTTPGNIPMPLPLELTRALDREASDFVSALREKRQPLTNGRFAEDILRTIESFRTSLS